jgi:hypothetical protein
MALLAILLGSISCAREAEPVEPAEPAEPAEASANEQEVELVRNLIRHAYDDAAEFRRDDGDPEDPDHPLRDWSDLLWSYGEIHAGSEAAAQAARAALSMKGGLGEVDQMYALAGEVAPDNHLWRDAQFLTYTAWGRQDFDPVLELTEQKIAAAKDSESRAALQLLRGNALLAAQRRDEAVAALDAAVAEAPDSRWAEEAIDVRRVHTELAPGQPAQWPETTDTMGNRIALEDFAGRYLLLNFWASW